MTERAWSQISRPRPTAAFALLRSNYTLPVFAFLIQAALLATVSIAEVSHFSLTWDFANSYQTWYLIAHGNLDPVMTGAALKWREDKFDLLMWPLALVAKIWPSPLALKFLQDAAVVATTYAAWAFVRKLSCELVANDLQRMWIQRSALAILVLNPWPYMSNAFDFHMYAIEGLLAVLLTRGLYEARVDLTATAAILGCLAGTASTTIVFAAACPFFFARRSRKLAAIVSAIALCWLFVISGHLGKGDDLVNNYGYLQGANQGKTTSAFTVAADVLLHPAVALRRLISQRGALYANVAPSGLAGFLCPFTLGPVAVILGENFLANPKDHQFTAPGGQNQPAYALLTLGFAWLLMKASATSYARFVVFVCVASILNCALWFSFWYPNVSANWIRISDDTARVLASAVKELRPEDEVIASQGIVGAFAGRRSVYAILGGDAIPLREKRTLAFVTTTEGIEVATYEQRSAAIATLLATPGARVLRASDRFWEFEISGPQSHAVRIPQLVNRLPAGVFGTDGRRDFGAGSVSVSAGPRDGGYLVRGSVWQRPPGRYLARAHFGSNATATLEVWDPIENKLLAIRTALASQTISAPFVLRAFAPRPKRLGAFVFGYQSSAPQKQPLFEVRVRANAAPSAEIKTISIEERRH